VDFWLISHRRETVKLSVLKLNEMKRNKEKQAKGKQNKAKIINSKMQTIVFLFSYEGMSARSRQQQKRRQQHECEKQQGVNKSAITSTQISLVFNTGPVT
jgi:hypothetical protein